jgi:zinc resistance-associated protein
MRKFLLASVAVAGLATSAFAPNAFAAPADAPDMAQMQRTQERHALMLGAHLAAMKAGLKLTAEQEKNWPAFEAAIREAEKARADRWRQARERMASGDRPSPIERMTIMSEHLQKTAAQLQMVADAAKPLYDSLSDAQKRDFGPLMRDFKVGGRRR